MWAGISRSDWGLILGVLAAAGLAIPIELAAIYSNEWVTAAAVAHALACFLAGLVFGYESGHKEGYRNGRGDEVEWAKVLERSKDRLPEDKKRIEELEEALAKDATVGYVEELGRWKALVTQQTHRIKELESQLSFMTAECKKFEAENEKLREALAYWEDLGADYEALEKDNG